MYVSMYLCICVSMYVSMCIPLASGTHERGRNLTMKG